MVGYNYEAYPVLINIFLFLLLLGPVIYVYKGKQMLVSHHIQQNNYNIYIWQTIITILFCVFGYADYDFYHYQDLYKVIIGYQSEEYMEPVYSWLALVLPENYYVWRFAVWGSATILGIWTLRRLDLMPKVTCCMFTLFYLNTIYFMRGSLGIAILFLGYSFIVKPINKRSLSIIIGIALIVSSYFFHRTMLLTIAVLFLTPFKLNKLFVIASLILYPLLVVYVTQFLQLISFGGIESDILLEGTNEKVLGYVNREAFKYNTNGIIRQVIQYAPILSALALVTWKIVFKKIAIPRYIYAFFIYWYVITYIAFIFFPQETASWIFIRFIKMGDFPMVIVLSWYYATRNKMTTSMRIILFLALLTCSFELSYRFYQRL